jgi:hypothetical protein
MPTTISYYQASVKSMPKQPVIFIELLTCMSECIAPQHQLLFLLDARKKKIIEFHPSDIKPAITYHILNSCVAITSYWSILTDGPK